MCDQFSIRRDVIGIPRSEHPKTDVAWNLATFGSFVAAGTLVAVRYTKSQINLHNAQACVSAMMLEVQKAKNYSQQVENFPSQNCNPSGDGNFSKCYMTNYPQPQNYSDVCPPPNQDASWSGWDALELGLGVAALTLAGIGAIRVLVDGGLRSCYKKEDYEAL